MGGRAVEGTGLENRQTLAGLVGSNPTPSANLSSGSPTQSRKCPDLPLKIPHQCSDGVPGSFFDIRGYAGVDLGVFSGRRARIPPWHLATVKIRNAKASDKPQRLWDGGGLYLEVSPSGAKLWRLKYRYQGKEKLLALGQLGVASRSTRSARRVEEAADKGT